MDSVRKNANEVHKVKCFRNRVNFFKYSVNLFRKAILRKVLFVGRKFLFILCIALFPYYGDSSGAILEVPSEALLHLSVFSRSSLGRRSVE